MILILILLLSLVLRLYLLDTLPGEMWGDVNEHYELAQRILQGKFFYHYDFGGDGPLISYLIAFFAKIFGLSFYTIKLTTVFVDILSIVVIYQLALILFKRKEIAYISSFLMAVSFWNISLSRQGKPYILAPLFVMLVILFLLKRKNILAGFFIGLGMYSQASFWGMFALSFLNPLVFLGSLITSAPFFIDLFSNFNSYFNKDSYMGEKMGISLALGEKLIRLGDNALKNMMSFNFKGDTGFRHNISGNPHLDIVSGVFFVIGFLMIIFKTVKEKDHSLLKYFILPFTFVQLPSILDINNPSNVPNLGRMAGITPFVYMSIAFVMNKFIKKWKYILAVFLIAIFYLNFKNYFYIYPRGLPNNNTPFARIIASTMDKYPNNVTVGLVGCCWGEWGQPEPKSIAHSLKTKREIKYFYLGTDYPPLFCNTLLEKITNRKFVLFMDPNEPLIEIKRMACFKNRNLKIIKNGQWKVVKVVEGELE